MSGMGPIISREAFFKLWGEATDTVITGSRGTDYHRESYFTWRYSDFAPGVDLWLQMLLGEIDKTASWTQAVTFKEPFASGGLLIVDVQPIGSSFGTSAFHLDSTATLDHTGFTSKGPSHGRFYYLAIGLVM